MSNKSKRGNPRAYTAKSRSTHHFSTSTSVSSKIPTQKFTNPAVHGSAAQQSNGNDFINYLNGISNYSELTRDSLVEHMYTTVPEIATAIDSFALMVRTSYQYFEVINYNEIDNIPEKLDVDGDVLDFTKGDTLAKEMVDVSNAISKSQDIPSLFEQYGAILKLHGTLFLLINDNGSLTQIPNDHVTVIDKVERIQGLGNMGNTEYADLITEANFMVIDENLRTQRIIPRDKFMIIKYHDTPIYIEDSKGRITYGIYGVSPLRRAITPVWYRQVVMANDALWRARAMPRTVHSLSAESFNTSNFTGTPQQKLEKAQHAAAAAIENHKISMEGIAPDSSIVVLDTTKVGIVEPSSATHLDTNGIIDQMTDSIYTSIGLPRSIIEGLSSSNFAGELVIYSHANMKIIQIAEKISRAILQAMKRKLLLMNKEYPVDLLTIKINYNMSINELEEAKIAQVMDTMEDKFTDTEVRARMNYQPMTKEQQSEIEAKRKRKLKEQMELKEKAAPAVNNGGHTGPNSNGTVSYPTTSRSASQQPTDSAQAKINKALDTKGEKSKKSNN